MAVRALSIHADYKCRNSGVCCSVGWDVPVELPIYRSLIEALAAGRLHVSTDAAHLEPFVVGPDLPDDAAAVFERTDEDRCVFFERGSRLCIVHRDLGEPALPTTCRHFPRVTVRDRRGTFVALSHFCPTAASMLFREDVPVRIVEDPVAFPPRDYDGLAVGPDDFPPLLTPTVLMDLDAYSAWERHMVGRAAELARDPDSVLATLARDAQVLRRWKPGQGTLVEAIAALPREYVDLEDGAGPAAYGFEASLDAFYEAIRAVPDELKPEPDEHDLSEAFERQVTPRWREWSAPVNRYIAAKAFASWTAYQGRGVATIVRGLEAAVALVRVEAARECRNAGRPLDQPLLLEAFRSADFLLNHLAVGEDLAANWSAAEM